MESALLEDGLDGAGLVCVGVLGLRESLRVDLALCGIGDALVSCHLVFVVIGIAELVIP